MTVERFEELRIWQEARVQANALYDLFEVGSRGERDFGFRDQLQRCGVSVMNNIAEGFERRSDASTSFDCRPHLNRHYATQFSLQSIPWAEAHG